MITLSISTVVIGGVFICSAFGVFILFLLAVLQSEQDAAQIIAHMIRVIKSLLLKEKKENAFLPECYLVQADDVVLKFKAVKDGLDVILIPREATTEAVNRR